MKVLPVIHHSTPALSLEQATLCSDAGADGVFLISHSGMNDEIIEVSATIKSALPELAVGVNLLGERASIAADRARTAGLDMVWADVCGVSSAGLDEEGQLLQRMAQANPGLRIFAAVAFKYQPAESNPAAAAANATAAGFVATTSGMATGEAADIGKIQSMSRAANGALALASGVRLDNIEHYADLVSHVLVATGVSRDFHHFDYGLLRPLVARARSLSEVAPV